MKPMEPPFTRHSKIGSSKRPQQKNFSSPNLSITFVVKFFPNKNSVAASSSVKKRSPTTTTTTAQFKIPTSSWSTTLKATASLWTASRSQANSTKSKFSIPPQKPFMSSTTKPAIPTPRPKNLPREAHTAAKSPSTNCFARNPKNSLTSWSAAKSTLSSPAKNPPPSSKKPSPSPKPNSMPSALKSAPFTKTSKISASSIQMNLKPAASASGAEMVGDNGLEPSTSTMSMWRS